MSENLLEAYTPAKLVFPSAMAVSKAAAIKVACPGSYAGGEMLDRLL
jgi:hypothetical protein